MTRQSAPRGEAEFRGYAREFLRVNAQRRIDLGEVPAYVPRDIGMAFQAKLFEAGLAGLTVPAEYGGAGLGARHLEIFNEEAAEYWLPTGLYTITIGMCVPVLLQFGTDEQKLAHVSNMLRGTEIWCQMFSEPDAGSDVAALKMTAVLDGDEWVLNGQKIWTSSAHYASFGMCVARTNPSVPKHRGLSMFIVPMDTPGVEVRPLVLMTGEHSFNEVFCTEARIPTANLVGDVDQGWRYAIAMLMNERVALGASGNSLVSGRADVLIESARQAGVTTEPALRQELADLYIREEVLRYVALRVRAAIEAGRTPGPEGSIAKLAGSELVKRAAAVTGSIDGPRITAWSTDDDVAAKSVRSVLSAPSMSIAGGTSEIQRNIIAERVLGLPKDPGTS